MERRAEFRQCMDAAGAGKTSRAEGRRESPLPPPSPAPCGICATRCGGILNAEQNARAARTTRLSSAGISGSLQWKDAAGRAKFNVESVKRETGARGIQSREIHPRDAGHGGERFTGGREYFISGSLVKRQCPAAPRACVRRSFSGTHGRRVQRPPHFCCKDAPSGGFDR
jgi:hypothetical protein